METFRRTLLAIVVGISASSVVGIFMDEPALLTWGAQYPISLPAAVAILMLAVHGLFNE